MKLVAVPIQYPLNLKLWENCYFAEKMNLTKSKESREGCLVPAAEQRKVIGGYTYRKKSPQKLQ